LKSTLKQKLPTIVELEHFLAATLEVSVSTVCCRSFGELINEFPLAKVGGMSRINRVIDCFEQWM
jgi:hypothetical protein